jgi:hypothetical protein
METLRTYHFYDGQMAGEIPEKFYAYFVQRI